MKRGGGEEREGKSKSRRKEGEWTRRDEKMNNTRKQNTW